MATDMRRLQISLSPAQAEYLSRRARCEGSSIAALLRNLIDSETKTSENSHDPEKIWDIAGIAEDKGILEHGVPVSEAPEHYLYKIHDTSATQPEETHIANH